MWHRALLVAMTVLSLGTLPRGAAGAPPSEHPKHAGELTMHLHHMHTLMNHALMMALQGSNLLMHSQMEASPAQDRIIGAHGKEMLADGKDTLKAILSGPEMKLAHEQGRWSDQLMGYTHELGAELLAVVDGIGKIELRGGSSPAVAMKVHHTQIALNHALEMAAEGSNLVMLGRMQMAGAFDERTVAHGRKMLAQARKLWNEMVAGEWMKEMQGVKGASALPSFVKHGDKVLTLLEKMAALQY